MLLTVCCCSVVGSVVVVVVLVLLAVCCCCGCDPPDGAVVAPGDGDRLFRVEVERPQLPLTVTLHQQHRFVSVSHHHLKDLTVLRPRQDPVRLPAHAADRQA